MRKETQLKDRVKGRRTSAGNDGGGEGGTSGNWGGGATAGTEERSKASGAGKKRVDPHEVTPTATGVKRRYA